MKPEELCSIITCGIESAQKKYERISNGYWLWSGAEYFLTATLAEYIHAESSKLAEYIHAESSKRVYCTVEEPLWEFSYGRGRPSQSLRINGRADIALWDEKEEALAIVEVKVAQSVNRCRSDLERIATFAKKTKALGAFAYYYPFQEEDAEATQTKINSRHQLVLRYCEEVADKNKVRLHHKSIESICTDYDDGISGWIAFAAALSD